MKSKFRKTINTLKYLPIVATAFLAQELKGQNNLVLPTGVSNPFLSPDATETAKIYNANNGLRLEDIAVRDNIADARIKASRVHTIPPNDNPVFNCNNWTQLQIVNAYDFGENTYDFQWNTIMYNGYKGFVLSEIYANRGTLADAGKDGLPLFSVTFSDPVTRPEGHAMVLLFSGNNILDPKSYNIIEPRDGITKVKPGELNIPLNCEKFRISYNYIFENNAHKKNYGSFTILEFKIVNGEMILTYNVNDDPKFNNKFRVITERENDKPIINVKSTSSVDSLVVDIIEANPKTRKLRIDGGAFIDIAQNEKRKLNLPVGTHTIEIFVDDYFRLSRDTIFTRTITEPVTLENKLYPNPTQDILHIKYQSGMSGNAFLSIYTLDGKPVMRKKINGATEEDLDMTRYKSGTYILQVEDGAEKQRIKFIKE